ncbi:MAG: hypothetical protein HOU81_16595 [Hamadaea sp.]|nr:hypothetical protein [Hamadaea sp.]
MTGQPGPAPTAGRRPWVIAFVLGVILCGLGVAAMTFVNIASSGSEEKTVRLSSAGTVFAAETGLGHEGSSCQISLADGQCSAVELPPPSGASTYDTRYRGVLIDVEGPGTVSCHGRELLVATGFAGRLLALDHLPAIVFVLGAVMAVAARLRLRR